MARIYESQTIGPEFQGSAQSVAYRPVQAFDNSKAIKEREYAKVEDAKAQGRALARQAELDNGMLWGRNQIEQAHQKANQAMVNGLLSLTKTGLDAFTKFGEIQQQVKMEDELLDSVFGSDRNSIIDLTPEEQQTAVLTNKAADADAKATAKVTQELDATGKADDALVANTVRQEAPSKAFVETKANVSTAIAEAPAVLSTALASLPPGVNPRVAAQEVLRQYMRANGLFGLSRDEQVRFAKGIQGYLQGAIYNAAQAQVKATQEENLLKAQGTAYDRGRNVSPDNVVNDLAELSNLYGAGNVGYGGRSTKSNAAALSAYLEGVARSPNGKDIIDQIRSTQMENGATWGSMHGELLDRALDKAEGYANKREAELEKDLEADMYSRLSQAKGPEERNAIIQGTIEEMRRGGLHKQAHQLEGQLSDLQIDGQHEVNEINMEISIENGEVTSQEQLDKARDMGLISQAKHGTLSNLLKEKDLLKSGPNKDVVDSFTDRFEQTLMQRLGFKKDPSGTTWLAVDANSLISKEQAKVIAARFKVDSERYAQTWLSQNSKISDSEKISGLTEAMNKYFNENVKGEDGKYFLPNRKGQLRASPEDRGHYQTMASAAGLNAPTASRGNYYIKPRDWTSYVQPGKPVGSDVRQHFRALRGDKIFTLEEAQILAQSWENGQIQQSLKVTAQSLGMTPLALLNSQLAAYGKDGLLPMQSVNFRGQDGALQDAQSGANYLIQRHGMSVKGAAWLSGNIQQESRWSGRRTWDDVGARAGGLVSWRAGRLENIERQLGTPITQASHTQQLDAMIQEMKTKYPSAYATFTNPYATDRQLLNASYAYWGWGEQGKRAEYAAQIEAQLRAGRGGGGSSRASTPQQTTINVGRQLLKNGITGIWQHPNFDLDGGYQAGGGARVGTHSPNSYHKSSQALDIPMSHNSTASMHQTFKYLVRNQKQLGIKELFWNKAGFYKNGASIGGPGSNAIPDHDSHIHVSFG